jgi:hypothetical protein
MEGGLGVPLTICQKARRRHANEVMRSGRICPRIVPLNLEHLQVKWIRFAVERLRYRGTSRAPRERHSISIVSVGSEPYEVSASRLRADFHPRLL